MTAPSLQFQVAVVLLLAICVRAGKGEYGFDESSGPSDNVTQGRSQRQHQGREDHQSVCLTAACKDAATALLNAMDFAVDPCDDFYQYACGSFIKNTNIANDEQAHSVVSSEQDSVNQELRELLESQDIPKMGNSKAISLGRRFYRLCMDTDDIEKRGGRPLVKVLKRIEGGCGELCGRKWSEKEFNLPRLLASVRKNLFHEPFLRISVGVDDKNVSRMLLNVRWAPTQHTAADYLNDSSGEILADYKTQIVGVVELLQAYDEPHARLSHHQLEEIADGIIDFEKRFSAATDTPADKIRYASEAYRLWTVGQLKQAVPFINFEEYFDAVVPAEVRPSLTDSTEIIMYEERILKPMAEVIASTEPRSRILTNSRDRWKTCVWGTQGFFPQAVGALYVDRSFSEKDQFVAEEMVGMLRLAFAEMISQNSWMDVATKAAAQRKLKMIVAKVGHPDFARDAKRLDDYHEEELKLIPTDAADDGYFDFILKLRAASRISAFKQLIRPVDRFDFADESPASVNAFYGASQNIIALLAAELRPPFFSSDLPRSMNFGGVGVTIGHELTHGFDDNGRQFDGVGNLVDWWSADSKEKFLQRAQCIIDQYSSYTLNLLGNTYHVDGIITQSENIADSGGIKEAFKAYKALERSMGADSVLPNLNITSDQLFFLSFASRKCEKQTDKAQIRNLLDVHAPAQFRVMGSLSNFDEFARAFNCKPGTKMNPRPSNKTKCEVW